MLGELVCARGILDRLAGADPPLDRPEPELPEEDPREESFPPGTYARTELHPGARIAGPSIVTEFDSTTVVLEGYTAEIDRYFNLLIRPEAS